MRRHLGDGGDQRRRGVDDRNPKGGLRTERSRSARNGQEASASHPFSRPLEGPARHLWLGLVLIVVSSSVKQLLVSWSTMGIDTMLEGASIELQERAEVRVLDDRYDDEDRWDEEAYRDKRERIDQKLDEARKDHQRDLEAVGSSSIATAQWFFFLKLFLDMAKILGAALILFGSLHIAMDPEQPSSRRTFANVAVGITLLTVALGGLLALLG